MNLFFGQSHLDTINDLREMAKRHNSTICFGIDNTNNRELNEYILLKNDIDKKVIEILREEDAVILKDIDNSVSKIWFELHEMSEDGKTKYNTLSYMQSNLYFRLEDNSAYADLTASQDAKLANFIDEHISEYGFADFTYNPTVIWGFGNKGKLEDWRVYRPDMALKFFSDLVCDYFNEPRILRTY